MHVLYSLQKIFAFELKGGTSLSRGYSIIDRFSEDIDIKIDPMNTSVNFKVYTGKNHNDQKHRKSRAEYYEWLTDYLNTNIEDIQAVRDYDDPSGKFRNGGIRIFYTSTTPLLDGLKEGILLEVGFSETHPNSPRLITSWAYNYVLSLETDLKFIDNRAQNISCYDPEYTFIGKLQAIVTKYRKFKEEDNIPNNFMRHYYDIYRLLEIKRVNDFIGTPEYLAHKKKHFNNEEQNLEKCEAFKLSNKHDRDIFIKMFDKTASLYYLGRPTLDEILERIQMRLHEM